MSIGLNESYPKGTKGILKMLVILSTVIAFACIIDIGDGRWYRYNDKLEFFVSSHIAGFAIAIILFIVFLINLDDTLGNRRCWNILNLIASIILAIVCIISSALIAEEFTEHSRGSAKSKLIAGYICGFISGVIFAIDAVIHFKEIR